MKNSFNGLISLSFLAASFGIAVDAEAASRRKAAAVKQAKPMRAKVSSAGLPPDTQTEIKKGIPVDVSFIVAVEEGGKFRVLNEDSAHEPRDPASTTKLMAAEVIFDELKEGRLTLTDRIVMTKEATTDLERALLSGRYGVKAGQTFSVEEGLYSLFILSSNDVALSFATHIGGGRAERFIEMMNEKAKALGMTNSHFANPHGLRDKNQYVTAYDMMKLGLHQNLNQSEFSHYSSALSFNFRGKTIKSENALLASYNGANWSKTGYTFTGYQIVLSAVKDFMNGDEPVKRKIFGGFFGGVTPSQRYNCMGWLMDEGFRQIGYEIKSQFKFSEVGCSSKRNHKSGASLTAGITPQ